MISRSFTCFPLNSPLPSLLTHHMKTLSNPQILHISKTYTSETLTPIRFLLLPETGR
ncbi:hypothetical protein HanRHA438_Chr16g0751981 [Helianthus annuus]|nr:hypothetical protein HanIR_Chr16g0804391 [Helianthus annuus]KAJ0835163.1 hypothetical protein HanRHA438_Chr16g0751981 [Helianthus annuus]